MAPEIRLLVGTLAAVLACSVLAASGTDPDRDPQLTKLLDEARTLLTRKQPQAALVNCEKVITAFKDHYANAKEKIYCARSSTESLGYLLQAAANADKGKPGKKDAIVLSSTWASAYFLKGYALQELNRIADAKSALMEALELSPSSSLYLSELGSVYKLEKNWKEAKKAFDAAEEHAALSPDELKATELGLARRGQGYVLVELGQLAEAEKKYLQCLKDDPTDKKAAAELEYVRNLKAKTKS
ncbi:MAG TPA: tetratricopeptide repeat protein [Chthoniobacterales bacterium]|nr:tetratricopeptide repeat protein [Chthoniobacterales bacterium]